VPGFIHHNKVNLLTDSSRRKGGCHLLCHYIIFNGTADSSNFSGVEVSASFLLVCVGLNTQVWDGELNIFGLSGCLNIDLVLSVHDFKHIAICRVGSYMCVWCCNTFIIIFLLLSQLLY
jgi:hypothetical protein